MGKFNSSYSGADIDSAVKAVLDGTLQNKLIAGDGIKIEGPVISNDIDHSQFATKVSVEQGLSGKQDIIPDLDSIRSGASKGSTAIQEHQDISHLLPKVDFENYVTETDEQLAELAHKGEVRHIERDLGMYPELAPVPLNSEVTGKYINSDGKYVDASGWNVASIGAVSLGNTYLLNMVSSANMVLGVALFVSRVYKRDKEGKIIGTILTPLFSAKNTSIPASGYVLFEAMDDYEEVLICYKPELTTQMLVARWGFKASHATQLRNLRLVVDNKTDFEGIYELLTAGYALNLVGKGNGEPQAFMSRKTGGGNITDGSAVIKEVDGVQPIVWNQMVDRNALPIALPNSSVSENGDETIINSTVSYGGCRILLGNTVVIGHKYLISVYAKSDKSAVFSLNNGGVRVAVPLTYATIYDIDTAKQDDNRSYFYIWNTVAQDNTITYKKSSLHFIDLTQMFGAGNEPSTYEEYLNRISHYHIKDAYAYNAGEVVNYKGAGVKTTGRNIWDEQGESGKALGENGEEIIVKEAFLSSFIEVLPNTDYFGRFPREAIVRSIWYDENKVGIGSRGIDCVNNATTSPSNAKYFRFYIEQSTYNHDICINLSDPVFNGQYEPYKTYVRDWSEVMRKYFPDGMTSLNGVKDFFDDKKAVRKWGCKVFDGTEDWLWVASGGGSAQIYTNEALPECKGIGGLIFNVYSVGYYVEGGTTRLLINGFSTSINTKDSWKSHLAELYAAGTPLVLYYELAEPVEDIFEKPLNLTYTVINGGTETSLATENSTQFEGSIAYNKDYVAVVDELQMQNRVTQIEFENWEN